MAPEQYRPSWVEVDLDAIRHNVGVLLETVRPAQLCAVVTADGYGHGAVAVAHAALEAGASWLAVALVEEAVELRDAGIKAPVLILSEPPADAWPVVAAHGLRAMIYSPAAVAHAEAAAAAAGGGVLNLHVKVDTGMHRVGATPGDAAVVAAEIARAKHLRVEGLATHLAVADEVDNPFTAEQLRWFEAARDDLAAAGVHPDMLHTSNSAGAIAHPAARYDLVRCGIAIYGYAPGPSAARRVDLRPAMSLRSRVSYVKRVKAGAGVSYGLRYACPTDTVIATVPLGYADGVTRRLAHAGGHVLVGGRRVPFAGTITMDQLTLDCGADASVAPGDEVVLLGRQGEEEITADEWALALDTISYEVVSRIGPRVPRVYRGTHEPGGAAARQPRLTETVT